MIRMLYKLDMFVITCHIALCLFFIVFWSADVRRMPVLMQFHVLHASVPHDYDGFGYASVFPIVLGF